MSLDKKSIEEKVLDSMESLRPFLKADGGDMELVEIKDDGTVVLRLLGACSDCSMSMMTLRAGIEESLKKAAPEVTKVVAINMPELV